MKSKQKIHCDRGWNIGSYLTGAIHLLKITVNLIGRTIFITSENYCMTNHRLQTKMITFFNQGKQ